jgi:hypothetical protein
VDVPFTTGVSEGFRTTFRRGDYYGRFWWGTGIAASSSEIDEAESNKSNSVGVQPAPPPPAEVEDVLPSLILTFTDEVFSMMLSPEDCELHFVLRFKGLANANS